MLFIFFRSRSATPSSYPGTPPQNPMDTINTNFQSVVSTALNTSALQPGQIKPSDFQPRNYSDFIRSLAAKYNNSNPNEYENLFAALFCILFFYLFLFFVFRNSFVNFVSIMCAIVVCFSEDSFYSFSLFLLFVFCVDCLWYFFDTLLVLFILEPKKIYNKKHC